eukprot:SAG31_NODE_2406_length_5762_cov_6.711107_3_plen_274_part_00
MREGDEGAGADEPMRPAVQDLESERQEPEPPLELGSQASTDTTSTRAKTRGALLGGLRSGALEQAVAKMEQEEEQQLPLPPSPPPPQQQPSVGASEQTTVNADGAGHAQRLAEEAAELRDKAERLTAAASEQKRSASRTAGAAAARADAADRAQLKAFFREAFAQVDVDADGAINRRELIKALRANPAVAPLLRLPSRIRQTDGSQDSFEELFQKIDLDGDGTLDWSEFEAHFFGTEVRSYFLVFVPTIREIRTFIARCNALIEKVSPCRVPQ